MLWEVKGFARVGGRGLFDAYCDGEMVVEHQSYDTCVDYVKAHAADTDLYREPYYTKTPRTWAEVKAEWATLKFLGE